MILYAAVCNPQLTTEDIKRMNKYGLRGNCLKDAPLWLKKWSSITLQYIEFEEWIYSRFFEKEVSKFTTQADLQIEAKNWSNQ